MKQKEPMGNILNQLWSETLNASLAEFSGKTLSIH